jgi:hypothetical protein
MPSLHYLAVDVLSTWWKMAGKCCLAADSMGVAVEDHHLWLARLSMAPPWQYPPNSVIQTGTSNLIGQFEDAVVMAVFEKSRLY